jgi:hypothetical protein
MKLFIYLVITLACSLTFTQAGARGLQDVGASRTEQAAGQHKDVVIPFELANKNIFVQVTVGRSRPLWFVLDTGDKYACIDLSIAKSLGLELGDQVPVGGGGKDTVMASLLRSGSFSIIGLEGFSQPLFIAVPFEKLSKASGREFAGILGFDFISQFVVEIDYLRKTITLHNKEGYQYHGDGENLPITFNAAAHPQVRAQVIDGGRSPIEGTFVLDLGSGAALMLNRPFVDAERFFQPNRATVPWIEGLSFGGGIPGSVGRIGGIKLGGFKLSNPVTIFTQASTGAFASAEAEGNIGAAILEKFNVILDYGHNRIILEPNSQFMEPLEYNRSGLYLVSSGEDYKTFKIDAIGDHSPASEVDLKTGDVVTAINGHPATEYTLSQLRLMIQDAKECDLTVERANERLQVKVKLKLRRLI